MLNDKSLTREDLIHKLEILPDEQLPDVAHFLEHLEKKRSHRTASSVMEFAGAWEDMDAGEFDDMMAENRRRRKQAFTQRPGR